MYGMACHGFARTLWYIAVTTMLVWYTLEDRRGNDALNDECQGYTDKNRHRCFRVAKQGCKSCFVG